MTITVPAPVSADTHPSLEWIRPWYPSGATGHIFIDCERLLFWEPEPDPEGGPCWLDPHGANVCTDCLERHQGGEVQ